MCFVKKFLLNFLSNSNLFGLALLFRYMPDGDSFIIKLSS